MQFKTSEIPFPPTQLDPGSCQAVRIAAIFDKSVRRVPPTAEWRAEQEAKQRAYEKDRQAHYERVGIKKL